jgi:DNA-directed RNA polymerase specialized sigma24 family protein
MKHPPERLAMLASVRALAGAARDARLMIPFGRADHVDDEVVVTLLLETWRNASAECGEFAAAVLWRITTHVRAHVRKNPGWPSLGGGGGATTDDFCQDIALAILDDTNEPCHAEVAFGNYVWKRCLDQAAKLFAKKRSAGQSLDDGGTFDEFATDTIEDRLIELEEEIERKQLDEDIREIIQELPELPRAAITYRYFGAMKIESKDPGEVTVSRLLGVTEKTATKYINQAVGIIRQRLNP